MPKAASGGSRPQGPPAAHGAARRHDPGAAHGAGSRHDAPAARRTSRTVWLLLGLPLLLAVLVHRRAFDAFFSTDDFVRLEEAKGLLPGAFTLWRLVSEVLYVELMLALFGPRPLPFHIVSVALHLLNTAFVFRLGRKAGLSAAGACLAATVFGAFPLFYTVLLSAVNINDILALALVFLALLALEVPSPARIAAAVFSFALALLSKEAVLFVPFAALLLPLRGERLAATARRLAPLLIAGVAFAGLYLAFRRHGLGTGGTAYALGLGPHLFHNLMTYAYWGVDLIRPVPDARGVYDPTAWRVGLWPLVFVALCAAMPGARRSAIAFGAIWWLLGLAPVLPLLSHVYGHYLYIPMAGFAVAATGALESAAIGIGRRFAGTQPGPAPARPRAAHRPPRRQWVRVAAAALPIALAIGFAARAEGVLRERTRARLGKTGLALDPFTRKMEVAQVAIASLTSQLDRPGDSVVVYTPPGLGRAISSSTGRDITGAVPATAPSYDMIAGALGGGLAVRLFDSRVDSIVFAGQWTRAYRGFNLFSQGGGGRIVGYGRGPQSHAKFGGLLLNGGHYAQAREYLSEVVLAFPEDRLLRLLFAATLSRTGDPDSARAHARLVLEGAPPDSITATAKRLLSMLDTMK